MDGLLIIVIVYQFLHVSLDLQLLLFDLIVNYCSHPSKISIYVSAFLAFYVLCSIYKIILLLEFCPKLLAPFSKNSKNSWALYDHVLTNYLCLRILSHILRYFSTNYPWRISFYSRSVFLILYLFIEILSTDICHRKLTTLHPISWLH